MRAPSRREFLRTFGTALGLAATVAPARSARASGLPALPSPPHPTPRVGITAEKVLTREQLAATPELIKLFDRVRAVPQVVDGIRCNCGCGTMPGYYSLLTCYEGDDAMARHCLICQGQGRLATRLHAEGKTLDAIRVAVDAQFG